MEDLNAVLVFLKVAELGGFVAAARSLDLPKSTVSLKVNELEQRLGVRLLHRTTRKVSLTAEGLYASQAYLKTYGEPKSLADLKTHPLIGISHTQNELTWTLHRDRQELEIETEVFRFRPRLASNDVIPLYQAVVGGLGIGLIPEFLFQMEQKDYELVNVLPQWSSTPVPINAIYSSHKYMPQKVKVFLDFLGHSMNANSIDRATSLKNSF